MADFMWFSDRWGDGCEMGIHSSERIQLGKLVTHPAFLPFSRVLVLDEKGYKFLCCVRIFMRAECA